MLKDDKQHFTLPTILFKTNTVVLDGNNKVIKISMITMIINHINFSISL